MRRSVSCTVKPVCNNGRMRFSLFSLIVLLFLAALTTNFLLLRIHTRESTSNAADFEEKTAALAADMPDPELVKAKHQTLTANNELLTETSALLLERFVDHTDSKYQIVPKEDHFSVLERPEYKNDEYVYLKSFLLYAPESQQMQIQVEFQPNRFAEAGARDFKSTEDTQFAIPHGVSELVVAFTKIKQENSNQTNWYLKIFLDDAEVISRLFENSDPSRGYSSSIFYLDPQRDYAANDKLPRLVRFRPAHCKSTVQLSVRRVEPGEQR